MSFFGAMPFVINGDIPSVVDAMFETDSGFTTTGYASTDFNKWPEFSKIIFCGVSIVTISITVFSCWIIYSTMDTSALAYLIPAVFAEMASATGFYYTKAKAENKIKLMNANGVQPEADNFNDF